MLWNLPIFFDSAWHFFCFVRKRSKSHFIFGRVFRYLLFLKEKKCVGCSTFNVMCQRFQQSPLNNFSIDQIKWVVPHFEARHMVTQIDYDNSRPFLCISTDLILQNIANVLGNFWKKWFAHFENIANWCDESAKTIQSHLMRKSTIVHYLALNKSMSVRKCKPNKWMWARNHWSVVSFASLSSFACIILYRALGNINKWSEAYTEWS